MPCPRRQPTIIGGPTGTGKTTLGQHLLLGAIGAPGFATLLGWPVAALDKGYALYLAADRPDQARLAMRRLLTSDDQWDTVDKRLKVWPGPPPASIAADPLLLHKMCAEAGARFLLVDSLKDCALQLSDDRISGAVNEAHQHVIAGGCDVVALHHPRKRSRDNPDTRLTIDDLYGGAWLAAGAGSVILLNREPTCIEAVQVKSANGHDIEFRYTMDSTTGVLIGGAIDEVLAAVIAGVTGIQTTAVARVVHRVADPTRAQVEGVRRQLRRLEESGLIHGVGSGPKSMWVPS